MWKLYNWAIGTVEPSNSVPPVPKTMILPSFPYLTDDVKPGPGRYIPPLLDRIKESKLNLKSPAVIKILKSLNQIDNMMFLKVRRELKHVKPKKAQTVWPCTNPLFIELRKKYKRRAQPMVEVY